MQQTHSMYHRSKTHTVWVRHSGPNGPQSIMAANRQMWTNGVLELRTNHLFYSLHLALYLINHFPRINLLTDHMTSTLYKLHQLTCRGHVMIGNCDSPLWSLRRCTPCLGRSRTGACPWCRGPFGHRIHACWMGGACSCQSRPSPLGSAGHFPPPGVGPGFRTWRRQRF